MPVRSAADAEAGAGAGAAADADAEAEEISSSERMPVGAEDAGSTAGAGPTVDPGLVPAKPKAITGIEVCDQYLSLYERCEPILRPEIMAGDRRPVPAEKAFFEYLATSVEKEELPEACQELLTELRPKCPVPEPAASP